MSGERKITPLITPPEENQNPDAVEEPKEEEKTLEPYGINVEIDALTGSECTTRDDNTLTVKLFDKSTQDKRLSSQFITYFDDTITK